MGWWGPSDWNRQINLLTQWPGHECLYLCVYYHIRICGDFWDTWRRKANKSMHVQINNSIIIDQQTSEVWTTTWPLATAYTTCTQHTITIQYIGPLDRPAGGRCERLVREQSRAGPRCCWAMHALLIRLVRAGKCQWPWRPGPVVCRSCCTTVLLLLVRCSIISRPRADRKGCHGERTQRKAKLSLPTRRLSYMCMTTGDLDAWPWTHGVCPVCRTS